MKNTLKNDRKSWKKYFIENSGLKHPKCPEEAFTEWKKYWLSEAGREESIQMSEMRKGKRKAHTIDSENLESTPTPSSYRVSAMNYTCRVLPILINYNFLSILMLTNVDSLLMSKGTEQQSKSRGRRSLPECINLLYRVQQ